MTEKTLQCEISYDDAHEIWVHIDNDRLKDALEKTFDTLEEEKDLPQVTIILTIKR